MPHKLSELLDIGVYVSEQTLEVFLNEWERSKSNNQTGESLYSQVVDDAFSGASGEIMRSSPSIEQEVKQRVLQGIENLEKSFVTSHPFVEEEIKLNEWRERGLDVLGEDFLDDVSGYYSGGEYNLEFFRKKIEEGGDDEYKNALTEEMIERWDALLSRKKEDWMLKEIDRWRKQFIEELYSQMEKFQQMKEVLGPFTGELGRLWDLSKGMWKDVNFEILKYHAELIERQPELQELANYLGRMQAEREELVEEMITSMELRPEFEVNTALKEEVVGIHESNDINNLLPSEVSLLDDTTMETLFYLKFAERKLLTYDFWGYTSTSREYEVEEAVEKAEEEKGPVIICVDTSGSMHGVPEKIAKTLCFAILRVALLQKRQCYLISFSTGIETIELSNFEKSLPDLIRFLTFSFHGGTDAAPALQEALRMLDTENYKKADVLMISDFVMGNLGNDLTSSIQERQNEGTEFHSLVIASSGNQRVIDVFDNNWVYDSSSSKPFKHILQKLSELRKAKKEKPAQPEEQ